jgi:hypothetical protein
VALDGGQHTRDANYKVLCKMASQDFDAYWQLANQLPNMTDASKNNQVFECMQKSGFTLVHFSVMLQANVSMYIDDIQFDGVKYLNDPKFKENEDVLKHLHEFFMDFVEKLDPLHICQLFKYIDNMFESLEIEWSTRTIFPSVIQFAEMARTVHSLYQIDKSTTNLPLSLQEFLVYIADMCWKLAWDIEDLQLKDIL